MPPVGEYRRECGARKVRSKAGGWAAGVLKEVFVTLRFLVTADDGFRVVQEECSDLELGETIVRVMKRLEVDEVTVVLREAE